MVIDEGAHPMAAKALLVLGCNGSTIGQTSRATLSSALIMALSLAGLSVLSARCTVANANAPSGKDRPDDLPGFAARWRKPMNASYITSPVMTARSCRPSLRKFSRAYGVAQ